MTWALKHIFKCGDEGGPALAPAAWPLITGPGGGAATCRLETLRRGLACFEANGHYSMCDGGGKRMNPRDRASARPLNDGPQTEPEWRLCLLPSSSQLFECECFFFFFLNSRCLQRDNLEMPALGFYRLGERFWNTDESSAWWIMEVWIVENDYYQLRHGPVETPPTLETPPTPLYLHLPDGSWRSGSWNMPMWQLSPIWPRLLTDCQSVSCSDWLAISQQPMLLV